VRQAPGDRQVSRRTRTAGSHPPASADDPRPEPGRLSLVCTADRGLPDQLAGLIDGHLVTFAEHVREGLLAALTAVGLEVMAALMEAEATELVDPKGRHDPGRAGTRHGGEEGSITPGGRRVPVRRPRVRAVGADPSEVTLDSYQTFAGADLFAEGTVARMLPGISTRRYPITLEPVGDAVEQAATSREELAARRDGAALGPRGWMLAAKTSSAASRATGNCPNCSPTSNRRPPTSPACSTCTKLSQPDRTTLTHPEVAHPSSNDRGQPRWDGWTALSYL